MQEHKYIHDQCFNRPTSIVFEEKHCLLFNYFGKMNKRSDELETQSLPTFSIDVILLQFNSYISLGLILSEKRYSKGPIPMQK